MPDVHDAATRSRNMAAVRGKNTKPELLIRRGLHGLGFRYRLQVKDLPGRPDLVLPKHRAVIFVHGCFWHGHDCHLFRLPRTRTQFWEQKISSNRERDCRTLLALSQRQWRTGIVWECAVRGSGSIGAGPALEQLAEWLREDSAEIVIAGEETGARNQKAPGPRSASQKPE